VASSEISGEQIVTESLEGRQPEAGSKTTRRQAWARREIALRAMEVIAEKGFDSATVEEIARAADYHPRSFHRYFETKEDVVFVGLDELTDDFRARCSEIQHGDDAWAVVRNGMVEATRVFAEADPVLSRAQVALWFSDPALKAPFADHFMEWERIITETFAAALGLKEPNLYTEIVGGAIISAMRATSRVALPESGPFARLFEEACGLLETGLAQPPAQSGRSARPATGRRSSA
jgi:AcrR family transcriptional regulator